MNSLYFFPAKLKVKVYQRSSLQPHGKMWPRQWGQSLTSQTKHANKETPWSRGVKWTQSKASVLPSTFLLSNSLEFTSTVKFQKPIAILDLRHRVPIPLCSSGSLPIQSKQQAVSCKNGKITVHFTWKRWPHLRPRYRELDPSGGTCFAGKMHLNCNCVSTCLLVFYFSGSTGGK